MRVNTQVYGKIYINLKLKSLSCRGTVTGASKRGKDDKEERITP